MDLNDVMLGHFGLRTDETEGLEFGKKKEEEGEGKKEGKQFLVEF